MITSKSIKNTAKSQLSNNWFKAFAAMAILLMANLCIYLAEQLVSSLLSAYGIIKDAFITEDAFTSVSSFAQAVVNTVSSQSFLFAQFITLFFLVMRLIVISPLTMGEVKWYYSVAKGSKMYISKMFFYFQSNEGYVALLMFKIGQLLRQILYGFISFFAAIAALSLSIYQFYIYTVSGNNADMQKAILYLLVTAFLILLGIVLYILLMLKYFLAEYLFASMNDFKGGFKQVNSCFARSKELMTGQTGRVITLILSFLPSILSCAFIVPILFVYPNIKASLAVLARSIIKDTISLDKK